MKLGALKQAIRSTKNPAVMVDIGGNLYPVVPQKGSLLAALDLAFDGRGAETGLHLVNDVLRPVGGDPLDALLRPVGGDPLDALLPPPDSKPAQTDLEDWLSDLAGDGPNDTDDLL